MFFSVHVSDHSTYFSNRTLIFFCSFLESKRSLKWLHLLNVRINHFNGIEEKITKNNANLINNTLLELLHEYQSLEFSALSGRLRDTQSQSSINTLHPVTLNPRKASWPWLCSKLVTQEVCLFPGQAYLLYLELFVCWARISPIMEICWRNTLTEAETCHKRVQTH